MFPRYRAWVKRLMAKPMQTMVGLVTLSCLPIMVGDLAGHRDVGQVVSNLVAVLVLLGSTAFTLSERAAVMHRERVGLTAGKAGIYYARCHCCAELFPERITKHRYGAELIHTEDREPYGFSWHCRGCIQNLREAQAFREAVQDE